MALGESAPHYSNWATAGSPAILEIKQLQPGKSAYGT
jgi:hypothetical protein